MVTINIFQYIIGDILLFFGGCIAIGIVWGITDTMPSTSPYRRGYRKGYLEATNDMKGKYTPELTAKWKVDRDDESRHYCSNCNQSNHWGEVPFCPWCGARMVNEE